MMTAFKEKLGTLPPLINIDQGKLHKLKLLKLFKHNNCQVFTAMLHKIWTWFTYLIQDSEFRVQSSQ